MNSVFLRLILILIFVATIAGVSFSLSAQSQPPEPTTPEVQPEQEIETISIEDRRSNMIGDALSASQGIVNQAEISIRPLLRTGEVLELVPGMVVTQHSGTGKANQYFLRGFNLDHGTDFATFIDDMPINMRTHGHGQGYTDLNFIIPETVQSLAYNKGAYYSEVGDFSGAGSASFSTSRERKQGFAELSLGQYGYQRLVALQSLSIDEGELYFAGEITRHDGPWTDISEDLNKYNGLLGYTHSLFGGQFSLSAMAYDNRWNSADQIPLRAVTSGLIDEFGSLDDTVGGASSRYSINAQWHNKNWSTNAYIIDYELSLWSNFTYFLDNEDSGDQFQQVDKRVIYGANTAYDLSLNSSTHTFGAQYRLDKIEEVGLYRSAQRTRIGAIRSDAVDQLSLGVYWDAKTTWTDNLRSQIGVRYDYFDFDTESLVGVNVNDVDLSANNGANNDDIFSLKGSLMYTLNDQWELYGSAGQGFHSNDARGTIEQIDPSDGSNVSPVDPLVGSLGYELGLRARLGDKVNASVALWALELDSELLFVGDAGNTEASRKSQRSGIELTSYYRIDDIWTVDLEYSFANAAFTDESEDGDNIPGAIEHVVQAGLSALWENGFSSVLRLRYFGERPLIEDASVKSDASTVINFRLGYAFGNFEVKADVLNLTDSRDHDIDYLYESRLANEPSGQGVEDIHYHVLEPRSVRVSIAYRF